LKPGEIIRSAPRRRQEDDVSGGQRRHNVEEVADDELDPVFDAVNFGVVSSQPDLVRVDVNGDDPLAGEGELQRRRNDVVVFDAAMLGQVPKIQTVPFGHFTFWLNI